MEINPNDVTAAGELAAEGPVQGTKFNLHIFTNDKTNPIAIKQLEMFYQAILASKIGLMHAKNIVTGKVETLLVGLELDESAGLMTFPLCKVLGEDDTNVYLPPDGNGGWVEDAVEEHTVN